MNIQHPRGRKCAASLENYLLLNAFTSTFSKLACTFKKKKMFKWGTLKHLNSLSFPQALPKKDGQGTHTRAIVGSSCLPHPRHSDFLIKHHLLNAKVQRTDLRPVSPELPFCKNAHLCRLKPLSLRQHRRVAPENQPAATCHHTGGAMTGQECRRNELFYRWWHSSNRCLASLMLLCVLLARATKAARLPAFVLTWLVLSGSLYREPSWTTRNSPLISSPRENLYIAFIASLPSPNLYDLCALKLKKNLFCESRTLEIIFWKSNKKCNWLSTHVCRALF